MRRASDNEGGFERYRAKITIRVPVIGRPGWWRVTVWAEPHGERDEGPQIVSEHDAVGLCSKHLFAAFAWATEGSGASDQPGAAVRSPEGPSDGFSRPELARRLADLDARLATEPLFLYAIEFALDPK